VISQSAKAIFLAFAVAGFCWLTAASSMGQNRRAPQPQSGTGRGVSAGQRLAPPAALKCSRDHLTSYTGRILAYQRNSARISLRVRTDEETTENFTVKLATTDEAANHYLMRGETFKQSDWKLIESSPGKLLQPMRATVWVCDDGSAPVIDWRPPERN